MRVYLAGPMQGIRDFNFPAFHEAARQLRNLGHEVFSPAEKDIDTYGEGIEVSETGDLADANAKGFSLRKTLYVDAKYICLEADAIAMLPGWENSKGAQAEWALARALGHRIMYLV